MKEEPVCPQPPPPATDTPRVKIIACEVMKEEMLGLVDGNAPDFEFVPQGLHNHPEKLNAELQTMLDATKGYTRVVLGFGLCGGGCKNLRAGDFQLTIPRVHDCIALLLGSRERFDRVRHEEPGTLYLSAGWVRGEAPVISEYPRTAARYGEKRAASLLRRIYNAYHRVLFIATGSCEEDRHIEKSTEAACVLGLTHEQTTWDRAFIQRLVNGPWNGEDFINIPPRGLIDELSFLG
jgi:hypothetical protein